MQLIIKVILFTTRLRPCAGGNVYRSITTTSNRPFLFKKLIQSNDQIRAQQETALTKASEQFFLTKPNTPSQPDITETQKKNKEAFQDAIELYLSRHGKYRRGHVEFIESALKKMKQYGVHQDLEVYKDLFNIFPKEVLIPKSFWQNEFFHYPKQQECGITLLAAMEENGVVPDDEFGRMIMAVFGYENRVMARFQRMLYWQPKMRHRNPWPVPRYLPTDPRKLYPLAVARISPDPNKVVTLHELNDSLNIASETTPFLVNCHSPLQLELVTWLAEDQKRMNALSRDSSQSLASDSAKPDTLDKEDIHEEEKKLVLYVDGPFFMWFREKQLNYYTLTTEVNERRREAQKAVDQRLEAIFDKAVMEKFDDDVFHFPKYCNEDEDSKSSSGPYEVWTQDYYTYDHLTGDANMHEQEDRIVLATCIPSSEDALWKWPEILRKTHFPLDDVTIVFRTQKLTRELVTQEENREVQCTRFVPDHSCPL